MNKGINEVKYTFEYNRWLQCLRLLAQTLVNHVRQRKFWCCSNNLTFDETKKTLHSPNIWKGHWPAPVRYFANYKTFKAIFNHFSMKAQAALIKIKGRVLYGASCILRVHYHYINLSKLYLNIRDVMTTMESSTVLNHSI